MSSRTSASVLRRAFLALTLLTSLAFAGPRGERPEVLFVGEESAVGFAQRYADAAGLRVVAYDHGRAPAVGEAGHAPRLVVLFATGPRGRGARGNADEVREREERLSGFLLDLAARAPDAGFVTTPDARRAVERLVPELFAADRVTIDEGIAAYTEVGVDRSNLRLLLPYVAATHLGADVAVEPARTDLPTEGLYHPAHEGVFADVDAFLAWSAARADRAVDLDGAPRAVVAAVSHHFVLRNREGIDALVRALEARGVVACTWLASQGSDGVAALARDFGAGVVLDTRHVLPADEDRAAAGVPFLQCGTLMRTTVEEWRASPMSGRLVMGLENHERAGSVEPRVFNGSLSSDGPRTYGPIDERVERIAARAVRWLRLRALDNADKRIAVFPGPMAGGTGDHQLLNTPASLAALFAELAEAGYDLGGAAPDARRVREDWDRRELGDDPADWTRAVEEGVAETIPVAQYLAWYEDAVPAEQRAQLEAVHGPPPGAWRVVRDPATGADAFVVPTLRYGDVCLLSTGGMPPGDDDLSAVKARARRGRDFVPGHNVLAVELWVERGLAADAKLRFGSFQLDLLLPTRVVGLGDSDWPEVFAGEVPDVRPFSMAATTFAVPARRRPAAVVIGHLTPPQIDSGLDEDLLDLRDDVLRWEALEEGALEQRFRATITSDCRAAGIDRDLELSIAPEGVLTRAQVLEVAAYLGRLSSERVQTDAHVLGAPPDEDARLRAAVRAATPRFLDALGALAPAIETPDAAARLGAHDEALRARAQEVAELVLRRGLALDEALAASGVDAPAIGVPEDVAVGFEDLARLDAAFEETPDELTHVVDALAGRFVPPGQVGTPERNPDSLPSGRSLYFFDPETLPTRASWDVGVELADELLEQWRAAHDGAWPRKVAVSLSTRGTMADYGVGESQVFHLLGVRPVRSRGRVTDVEVVPRAELGRPRVDVFVETKHYYNDTLRSRAELIDRAVRLVADLDEPDNFVRANRARAREELIAAGATPERADLLSVARVFAVPEGHFGSGVHDKLFGASGVWNTRGDLAEVYIDTHDHVFTEGAWGEEAPDAFRAHLKDAELVLRTTATRGALTGRAHYSGGNLANTIHYLSGRTPDYWMADLRDPHRPAIEPVEDMLRREMRQVLFHADWIRAMKDEGARGAARMAGLSGKVFGWKVNHPRSVRDEDSQRIVEVYVRDEKQLGLREFFDEHRPGALQSITKDLLEASRKEYWSPDRETLRELARVHADSVARHGLRIDENEPLARFVDDVIAADVGAAPSIAAYRREVGLERPAAEVGEARPIEAAAALADAAPASSPVDDEGPADDVGEEVTADAESVVGPAPVAVRGPELAAAPPEEDSRAWLALVVGGVAIVLLGVGAVTRKGAL